MDDRDQVIAKLKRIEEELSDDPSTEEFEFNKEVTTDRVQVSYTGERLPTVLRLMLQRPDVRVSRVIGKPKVKVKYKFEPTGEEYNLDQIVEDILKSDGVIENSETDDRTENE